MLYRGTTEERFAERHGESTTLPPNWTDDPLQAVSYALAFVIDRPAGEKDPLVLATPHAEDRFSDGSPGVVSNYWPDFPVDDPDPTWYAVEDGELPSRYERDALLERYPADGLDRFVETYMEDADPAQREAVLDAVATFS